MFKYIFKIIFSFFYSFLHNCSEASSVWSQHVSPHLCSFFCARFITARSLQDVAAAAVEAMLPTFCVASFFAWWACNTATASSTFERRDS